MIKKELKIRDICGDYALDIPNYNGSIFTLFFNSKKNAENVKHIIEIDGSKPNEATVCDMQKVVRCKDCKYSSFVKNCAQYECTRLDDRLFFPDDFCSYGKGSEE